jgi:vWA-MoxR associated protein C-terminal domain
MQELLTEFVVDGALEKLEIQFLADPPLFDAPFHSIPLTPGGPAIGEQAVVILRHRRRVLSSDSQLQNDWKNYAAVLRSAVPKEMTWLKIESGTPLPAKKGPCFAAFVLVPAHEGGKPCDKEKRLLFRLLALGAPCLFWAHALPEGANWETVERALIGLLRDLSIIDGFPNKFREERLRGSELATHASILWDDPLAKPFSELEGVDV